MIASPVRVLALALALTALPALASAQDRGGFTLLFNLGVGIQNDTAVEESAVGLGGLNIGVGGFLTPNVAVLGRFSGTNVEYSDLGFRQVSGVLGATVQFWGSKHAGIEVGGGMGYWNADGFDDRGFGLILAVPITLVNKGKHNLQASIEYAPVFTSDPVHNFCITFGYQLF